MFRVPSIFKFQKFPGRFSEKGGQCTFLELPAVFFWYHLKSYRCLPGATRFLGKEEVTSLETATHWESIRFKTGRFSSVVEPALSTEWINEIIAAKVKASLDHLRKKGRIVTKGGVKGYW
jgi:hypothetical protein